jgi:hypothetical protein
LWIWMVAILSPREFDVDICDGNQGEMNYHVVVWWHEGVICEEEVRAESLHPDAWLWKGWQGRPLSCGRVHHPPPKQEEAVAVIQDVVIILIGQVVEALFFGGAWEEVCLGIRLLDEVE